MLLIILGVVLADQIAKYYIASTMTLGLSLAVIPNVFHLTYILNPGAAFGILENQRWFFILIAVSMLGMVMYYYPKLKKEGAVMRFGTALLAGGAVGNLIDRIKTGYVVDFLDFRIWPIFNIADMGIVVGVGMMMYALFFLKRKKDEGHGWD